MSTTRHEADLINEDRHKQEQMMLERLKDMNIDVKIAHYTGDNSYPIEYTLIYEGLRKISAMGPTLDITLASFVGVLLKMEEESAAAVRGAREASEVMARFQATEMLKGVDQMMEAEIARGRSILEAQLHALELAQSKHKPDSLEWLWYMPRIAGARAELERYTKEQHEAWLETFYGAVEE